VKQKTSQGENSVPDAAPKISPVMRDLSAYISGALETPLPDDVAEKAKHHLLDTLASMISGSRLPPGKAVLAYARGLGGAEEATLAGSGVLTNAQTAALANGMLAHADETDDSHKESRSHLGCGVVPAALAMAEKNQAGGADLLNAVVLGYDVGARATMSLGVDPFYAAGHSTHTMAPLFGAAAAAGALARLSRQQTRWLISYAAQQASGVNCWQRDRDHIEKAFDFGGMAARNGVAAATMVEAGFTGVDDVFSGPRNFFDAFGFETRPEVMTGGLGARFEIMATNIKKWTVGSPIQAVLDSVQALAQEHGLGADDIQAIRVRMSGNESHVVDNREMASINLQHLVAILVLDGDVTFAAAHDEARMDADDIKAVKSRIELFPDPDLPRRKPVIEITTIDGKTLEHATPAVRGTPDNPMTRDEVEAKALDLISPIIGDEKARTLIDQVRNIEAVKNARDLRPYLS